MTDPLQDTDPHADDAPWASALRRAGAVAAATLGPPSSKEEAWRYTDTSRIPLDGRVRPSPPGPGGDMAPGEALADAFGERGGLALTTDAGTVRAESLHDGVTVAVLASTPEPGPAGDVVAVDQDLLTALNAAHFRGGVLVHVARGARVGVPLVVVHWLAGSETASFPRTLVVAEGGSECDVIEVWASPAGAEGSLTAPVTELVVGDGARVGYVGVQRVADTSVFVGALGARAGRDSRVGLGAVNVGAWLGRHRVEVDLAGPGAESDSTGVYFGDGDRHVDFRTRQQHSAPRGTSRLLFKGAVAGRSSAIYSGLIRVERSAPRTDAHQASRYLILSDDAKAASIPNLEIFNHDVKCGHASAGGPPDEEQLFYLESRGIAPDVARRMIVDGFFEEIVGRLPVAAARSGVRAELMGRVAASRGEP